MKKLLFVASALWIGALTTMLLGCEEASDPNFNPWDPETAIEIPKSLPERCKYFLISAKRAPNGILTVVSRQDCPTQGTYYSQHQVDCDRQRNRWAGDGDTLDEMRRRGTDPVMLGRFRGGDAAGSAMKDAAGWYILIPGSSDHDSMRFVCSGDGRHYVTH
jgi:hypothetical protein